MKTTCVFSVIVFFFLLVNTHFSIAATITSTQQGGAWKSADTWIGNIVPTENDDVIITSTVTVNGGSYSTSNYIAKNLTVQNTGKVLREPIGGYSILTVNGNLVNNGEIIDNADYFDMKLHGDFENNGVFKPRTFNMDGENPTISASAKIECKTFNIIAVNKELLATSNLHFKHCNIVPSSAEQLLNMQGNTLTLSADSLTYDAYYGEIYSPTSSRTPLKFSAGGKIILNKALLASEIAGNVTIASQSYGILTDMIINGDLTIENNSNIRGNEHLCKLNVSGTFKNYGIFCSDSIVIADRKIAPSLLKLIVHNNVYNYGNIGNAETSIITNGNTLNLMGDFGGDVLIKQADNSDKPGGKVIVNSDVNLFGKLQVYSNLEITKSGVLNLKRKEWGTLYVQPNGGNIINNGALQLYYYVGDSWSSRKMENVPGTSVNFELRDWESVIDDINIEVFNNQTYPGLTSSTKRWWRLSSVGTGTVNGYTAKFYYDESMLNGQTEENLKVYRSTDKGKNWQVVSVGEYAVLDTVENSLSIGYWARTESLLTEFGDFVISAGDGSVPVESNIQIDIVGRPDIRIGAPNPFTIHVYNVTDMPSSSMLIAINITDDMRFKEVHLPYNDTVEIIPADSMGNPDDNTQVFFIPYLEANEHYSFDVIVYGITDDMKSASENLVTLTLGGFFGHVGEDAAQDYIVDQFNDAIDLDAKEKAEYASGLRLAVKDLKTEKVQYGKTVTTFRHLSKYTVKKISESNPVTNIIFKIGEGIETVAKVKDSLRRRLFHWFYKEVGLYGVEEKVKSGKQVKGKLVKSWDPNEMVGPAGFGEANFMSSIPTMNYTIMFENKKEATAPAYRVQVFDTLSTAFDVESVKFGQTSHSGDNYNWKMKREGNVLIWDIEGIELPPNATPPEGEGFVRYSVELNQGLPSGTAIENSATIIFDMNPPITTNTWVNTLDFDAPQTSMLPINYSIGDTTITVACNANDNQGSGIGSLAYYVSKNGGIFQLIDEVFENEIIYPVGDTIANNYRFYAIATDNVQNGEQTLPAMVEVNTTPLDIYDLKIFSGISVYPNPTSGMVQVQINADEKFSYEIYSLTGKKLLISDTQYFHTTSIDLSTYQAGAYFLKVIAENEITKVVKLMVE